MHHAHILLVYSITPYSTTVSDSTPLPTPSLCSLIHADLSGPGAASTLSATAHGAGMLGSYPPTMFCAGAGYLW
jgi:hypothetical protein